MNHWYKNCSENSIAHLSRKILDAIRNLELINHATSIQLFKLRQFADDFHWSVS